LKNNKPRNFKIKKITNSSKTLRAATHHFCDDVYEASVSIKEKILEAVADKKFPKRLHPFTKKEKEEERNILQKNEEENNG